jgi:hypothetical protein
MLTKEVSGTLFVFEWLMFSHVVMVKEEVVKPLIWWEHNALRFPNVAFLAQQILGVPRS